MKRIGLYGSILVVILAGLAAVLLTPSPGPTPTTMTPATIEEAMATWSPPDTDAVSTLMQSIHETAEAEVYPTNTPIPPTPVFYDEYTIVVLGQDETVERCWRGVRCAETSHSDVFVIVHVTMSPTPKAVAVLVPRNLYVPDNFYLGGRPITLDPKMWAMQVYGRQGYNGIHMYVYQVFGQEVQAVFVTKMDRFVKIVDALGGLDLPGEGAPEAVPLVNHTGAEVLAYLRDNDNNWGCPTYDCNGRIFAVAEALRGKSGTLVGMGTLADTLVGFHTLYETDLGWDQILWLTVKYFDFELRHGEVKFVRLWSPEIVRADTPLNARGMVPVEPLDHWMMEVLKAAE